MVRQNVPFNGLPDSSGGMRLAPPRPDYRWRHATHDIPTASTAFTTHLGAGQGGGMSAFPPEPFDDEGGVYYVPEAELYPDSPLPEPEAPPEEHDIQPLPNEIEPEPAALAASNIMLLNLVKMYSDEWKLAMVRTSEDKSRALLLPRGSKLSIQQAIKRHKGMIITVDKDGNVTSQNLADKHGPWWKNVFRWF